MVVDGPGWKDDEAVDQHHPIFVNAKEWLSLQSVTLVVMLSVLLLTFFSYAPFQGRQCGVIYLQDISLGTYARAATQSLHASLDFAATTKC